jgi:hypothetical protein
MLVILIRVVISVCFHDLHKVQRERCRCPKSRAKVVKSVLATSRILYYHVLDRAIVHSVLSYDYYTILR